MTAALLSFASDWSALHNRLSDGRFAEQDLKVEPAAWTGANARPRPWLHVNRARQEISADAAFEQEVVKVEAGADVPFALGNGGTALIGAFLGLGRNKQDFDSSATEAGSDVALGGLYASYRNGGFYANAIAKYEHHQMKVKSAAIDDNGSSFDIDLLGGSVETGYRFAFASSYLQPRLRFNSVRAGSTSFEDASSTSIALESADSLAGEAAARLGFLFDTGEIYLDGGARHEFRGDTEASVSGLSFSDALPGTAGFIAGGLALRIVEGKVLLALEGGYAKGNEGQEVTASAALRVVY
jgi:outer membrane autotransporter protein